MGVVFILAALIFYFLFDELKVEKANKAELHNFIRRKALWIMSIIWIFAASPGHNKGTGCTIGSHSIRKG
ncbi:MAG: hypothetical protein NTX36_12990 [Proteobacteria bacterium]|nr:hypothetical protein [Pseudomonadota bacterium]